MRALYCENGRITLRKDYPTPIPQVDEALVRVTLAGICSTDLELVRGYVPGFSGVLGHEFVGIVEASADESWLGQRVVSNINSGCQKCAICLSQGPEHCPERRVLGIHERDGAFADFIAVPLRSLHRVPDGVPDEQAVFAEPLAAALRIREQVRVRPTAKTAVIGPGRLGLLVAQVLQRTSADITVLGRSQRSLLLPASWEMQTGVTTDYSDNQFDFVVEVTGNDAGFAEALRLLRPLGTLVLKSTFAGDSHIDVTKIVVEEITVVGSRCGPFDLAVSLLEEGSILTAPLIMGEYSLDDALAAFEKAAEPGVLKILIRP
jgi:threonine dehydrogenase-like Zn-dependent dehydrogenase